MEAAPDEELQALLKCTETFEKLSVDSRLRVLKYLISRYDPNITYQAQSQDAVIVGSIERPTGKKLNKKVKTSAKRTPNSYKLVPLNLYPTNAESLKSFYEKYDAKNFFEKNLIYVYYLNRLLSQDVVTIDDIYTCYKNTGQKVPGNLYQSLIDTRNRKNWLDTQDMEDIRVLIAGENYLEHEMQKK